MGNSSVESMLNMIAAIEADMLHHRFGYYEALKQVQHVEEFHDKVFQSKSLKAFEGNFWERVRAFIEIKHPELCGTIPSFQDARSDDVHPRSKPGD